MGRTFAVADIHGIYDLFCMLKNYVTPEDTVYVLGDCADRGPDGIKIIKEVLELPNFIYIKGNHEDLFVDAVKSFDNHLWFYNGGGKTYDAWDGDEELVKTLDALPVIETYNNKQGQKVYLCHAGFTPNKKSFVWAEDYIWDRKHFADRWFGEDNEIVVHGHTPVPCLKFADRDDSPVWYCDGHKLDIDMGAYWTNRLALVDLDTWEIMMFEGE